MTTDVITDADAMENLAPQWDALWRRLPGATPFQSPHWLLPWWKRFGSDTPWVIAVRDGGELEALAPLYVLRDGDESLGMFLGTGISDYLDVLASEETIGAVMQAIAAADCQMWDFQQLPPGSPLLAASLPEGWSENVEDQDPCPVLTIEGASLENLLSTHALKKLRYFRRALERTGELTFEAAREETIDPILNDLFELHAARWRRRGLPGVLADEVVQDFHRDVARRMHAAGALRLVRMRIGDQAAAVFYGFAHGGTVYYYLSGYDPAFEKRSVGNVIVAHAIEQAVRDGAKTFDFMRGAEEYKYAWGAKDRINRRRQLFRG
jgi:CelD/BcsL family acetyltransferase involved in cellulose biosynthesis